MKKNIHINLLTTFLILVISTASYAVEVIRANFEFQGDEHPVDISLFDTVASDTVINFLSYVDDSSYNNLIINRSSSGLVIQTGGYTFNSLDGNFSYDGNLQFTGGLQIVSEKASILNEFNRSNLRGTLAMARIGGEVDSASNQWFINLADNSFLDEVDEGFTVFGEVISSMDSIDQIAAVPVYDISSEIDINGSFVSIPLIDHTISSIISGITDSNLVIIRSFDYLFKITDNLDFGDVLTTTTNVNVHREIIIQNHNFAPLQIGNIDTSSVTQPFTLSNPCEGKLLQLAEQCIIGVDFYPTSINFFADSFNVEILTYGYIFPITLTTPAPDITVSQTSIDYGVLPIYDPDEAFNEQRQSIVYVNNKGNRDLGITSVTFDTLTPLEFNFVDNCTTTNAYNGGPIPADGFCILIVNFYPQDLNEKDASITIVTDDPDTAQLVIPVKGGASTDQDGITNTIEDASPNAGDGNNDEIPDRLQNNVVSFANANNLYTTLVTNNGSLFFNVEPIQLSTIEALPDGASLENEAFKFELSGFPIGAIAEFGLILPAGKSPGEIYSFGATADNDLPHWYTLEKDAIPGAIMFGNTDLSGTTGSSISRNITTIRIADGGYGDSDQQVNGKILFVGGPELTDSDSTGTMLWLLLLTPFSILIYRNNKTTT